MSFLSNDELDRVRKSWWTIKQRGGTTYVDGVPYIEDQGAANAVAAFFNRAADKPEIGLIRAEAMVLSYERHSSQITPGTEVSIHIETEPQGTIEW